MADDPPEMTIHPEDPDDEWMTSANQGRAFRVRYLTGALLVLLLLGGGFWGGVVAQKHHSSGSTSSLSALANRFAAARAGTGTGATGGFGGFGGGGGVGGAATTGTVINVQGNELDISDSSGNIVKVTISSSTRITRTATAPLSGLQIGDTVVVTGSGSGSGSGGSVSATAIRASAQGATATGTVGSATGAPAGG